MRPAKLPLFLCCALLFAYSPQYLAAQSPAAASYFERGRNAMSLEDWYSAAEFFIECLRLNPAHAEGTQALAECYYELGEFDEALVWTRKARALARGNMSLAVLEAHTLITLGRLDEAAAIIDGVLSREPYNREALFASGELDIARGRSADALLRYRDAVRRYPDDRRLLISLALVSSSLGDGETALTYIDRALSRHPEDYRVFYYASYINAQGDRLAQAIRYATQALYFKPGYGPARSLLANLRYRNGEYEEAARLGDESIAASRGDIGAWYLKGLSLIRLGRYAEAIGVLTNALAVQEDEFVRAALEDALIAVTGLEDTRRSRWASWHFDRARDFFSRSLIEQSLFEYRRGLRLNPYARDRREYAELLRLQGYPARYLEELRFLQDLGNADRSINDAVEAYSSLLSNALFRRWQVNPVDIMERHWNIAVFSGAAHSGSYHVDAGALAAAYVKDLLVHDRNIQPANLELRQPAFQAAWRQARESGTDYFLIVSALENERDISLKGELFIGRTGTLAGTFFTYRTGIDRLRNASRGIIEQVAAALPFRGKLVMRKQAQALIDKGRVDGVAAGQIFDIVKKGRPQILNEGIGLGYSGDELVGSITIDNIDEEVASGLLTRNGFFDRIEAGDEVILQAAAPTAATPAQGGAANPAPQPVAPTQVVPAPQSTTPSRTVTANPAQPAAPAETAVNPELRSLLRTLR